MLNQVSVFCFCHVCVAMRLRIFLFFFIYLLIYFIALIAYLFFFFLRYEELLFVGCHLLMFSFLDSPFMFALEKNRHLCEPIVRGKL